jgi:hypothetical protein
MSVLENKKRQYFQMQLKDIDEGEYLTLRFKFMNHWNQQLGLTQRENRMKIENSIFSSR